MTISVHKILIQRGYLCSLGKVYLEEVTAEQRSSAGQQGRESTFQGEGRRSLKQEGPRQMRTSVPSSLEREGLTSGRVAQVRPGPGREISRNQLWKLSCGPLPRRPEKSEARNKRFYQIGLHFIIFSLSQIHHSPGSPLRR